jgi:hypothetical protein
MMECLITKKLKFAIILLFASLLSSCYYDNGDDLMTSTSDCDTINMTYTQDIEPIMNNSCVGCHSGSAPSASISLSNYNEVKAQATNGNLMGVINHAAGYSPMPKNSPKMDDCTISKIQAWINNGSPN